MKEYLIVDMDGTVADCSHRIDFARAKRWDEFHELCYKDKPFPEVVELLNRLGPQMTIMVVTARPERYRNLTVDWMARNGIWCDELLMRPDNDYRRSEEMKLALIEDFFRGDKEEVLASVAFCLEDRDKVVEAFRNYGLPCWQVRTGDY